MREAVNYNRALLELVKAPARKSARLLDFGAGTGTFAIALAKEGYAVECVEPDPAQRAAIKGAGVRVHGERAAIPAASVDCVYTLNVLEHIEDDLATIRALGERLVRGGRRRAYVPPVPGLSTGTDA